MKSRKIEIYNKDLPTDVREILKRNCDDKGKNRNRVVKSLIQRHINSPAPKRKKKLSPLSPKNPANDMTQISVSLPIELVIALNEMARRDNRTRSNFIVNVLSRMAEERLSPNAKP